MSTQITQGAIYQDVRDGTKIMPVMAAHSYYILSVVLDTGELIQIPESEFLQHYYVMLVEDFHNFIDGVIQELLGGYPDSTVVDEWYEED